MVIRAAVAATGRVFICATNLHKHDPDTTHTQTRPGDPQLAFIYLLTLRTWDDLFSSQGPEGFIYLPTAENVSLTDEKRKKKWNEQCHKVAKNVI